MNILVINVSLRPESPLIMLPIGLGYIMTTMKRAGFHFDFLDIDAHKPSQQEVVRLIGCKKYQVVCLGCIVTGYKIVKQLAAVIKEIHPEARIIVGNSVATSIVDTLLTRTRADIAVMGEGDLTIVDLLQALAEGRPLEEVPGICFEREGKIFRNPPRPFIKDISSLPFIDYSLFDMEIYLDSAREQLSEPLPRPRREIVALPINAARGCIAHCTFCYHNFRGYPYRFRTADSIIAEIQALKEKFGADYIIFWDEMTFFSKKQALELVQGILDEDLEIHWTATCRGDLFDREEDLEIMAKMKEAGCVGMAYSLESADPEILKAMNKKMSVAQFSRQTQLFHQAGIVTWTSLVFGYPQETPETINKTFKCCIDNGIFPSAGFLLPQPGSRMYDYAWERGLIPEEEEYLLMMGDRQDLRVNLTQMRDEEFQRLVTDGLVRCNETLKIGLKYDELLKTKYYRVASPESG